MMARRIKSMIPDHVVYCEPFFGGGAVFFEKKPSKVEVINDRNDRLMTFYMQLQANHGQLFQVIKNTPHSESLSKLAREIYTKRIESDDLGMAWAIWMMTNGNMTGSPHGSWKWCNGTAGSHIGKVLSRKRERLSNTLYERIKYAQISCRDALRVIEDRDSKDTFFFLDPPYPGANQKHYSGYKFSDLYDLLHLIAQIKGKFILTNYWSQTIRFHVLKYGWDCSWFTGHINVSNFRSAHKRIKKSEVIVSNFQQPKRDLQGVIDFNQISEQW